jgi:hypothetical protein
LCFCAKEVTILVALSSILIEAVSKEYLDSAGIKLEVNMIMMGVLKYELNMLF